MHSSDYYRLIRPALIVAVLFSLLSVEESFAQVESAVESRTEAELNQIQVVAGSQPAANTQTDPFLQLLDQAIEITSKRTLTANAHSPWQIFHCILALRRDTVLTLGNQKVNALDWLSTTEPQFDGEPWLLLTPHGAKFHPYKRMYVFEGHPSQFLALLSHSNLPMDFPFHVEGKVVTLADLVNNTMKEVNTAEEVTWVLWALQHFLKTDAVWTNQKNETWSIEKLVQIESNAPVVGTPCGGNHRLFALTRARDKHLKHGGQLRGAWYQADQKIKQHIEVARSLQNGDGSFSGDWYKGPKHTTDVNLRFNTTGHTMEFLAEALPESRLNEQWVKNAVMMLSRELIYYQNTQIDCGPLFHSLDALIIYRDRIRAKSAAPDAVPAEIANSLAPKTAVSPGTIVPSEKTATSTNPRPKNPAATIQPPQKTASLPVENKPDLSLNLPVAPKLNSEPTKPQRKPELVTQTPTEAKLDGSSTQSVPTPVTEPPAASENSVKSLFPPSTGPKPPTNAAKPDSAKTTKPNPAMPGLAKPNNGLVPKLDPSKLPNIGQAAPMPKGQAATTQKGQPAKPHPLAEKLKQPTIIHPPALLPELSEPQATSTIPLPPKLESRPEPGTSSVDDSPASEPPKENCAGPSEIEPVVEEIPKEIEPISALEPVNG